MPFCIDPDGREKWTIESMVDLSGKRILEVGSGMGRETTFLVRPDNQVVGIDPAEAKLEWARQKCPTARFVAADMSDLLGLRDRGLVQDYDLIVFSMSLHHMVGRATKALAIQNAQSMRTHRGQILIIEPILSGQVTRLICAFDSAERDGLLEAKDILENSGERVLLRRRVRATARWVFDSHTELIRFFFLLFNADPARPRERAVTEVQIEAELLNMGLVDATELTDDIRFYLL